MPKPFILITGDDSVRGEGIILVKRVVEKFADYQLIATKDQQSAVSGKLNFRGGEWGKEIVDGHEAIWVDGSPGDAVNFAYDYLDKKPDIIISGMNIGENVDNSTLASGTFSAALRATYCRSTPAMAISLEVPVGDDSWLNDHNGDFREEMMEYPGVLLEKIIKLFIEKSKNWMGVWNINFPVEKTNEFKFCPNYSNNYFPNRVSIERDRFDYIDEFDEESQAPDSDVKVMLDNIVAITPIKWDLTDWEELEKLRNEDI
jgi:5'-nucleotidase